MLYSKGNKHITKVINSKYDLIQEKILERYRT